MATQINLELLWANLGGIDPVTDVKYEEGWVAEIPTFQNFNYILNSLDTNLLVLAEKGKYDWQGDINYEIGVRVNEGGEDYNCIVANINQQPSLDVTGSYWTKGIGIGGVPNAKEGILVKDVSTRGATTWTGNDVTISNENSLISLKTNNGPTKNLLLGNVSGELVTVDVGSTENPDGRSIALAEANTYRVFHEGHTPTKAEVGLGNVDNTSDINKPVSTAQAAAIDDKQDISGLGSAAYVDVGTGAAQVPNTSQADSRYLGIGGKAADSDKLDNLDSTFFRNAGNLNAGTVPDARLPSAATNDKGIVQLSTSVSSTSTVLAATSSAVRSAYNLAAGKASANIASKSSNGYWKCGSTGVIIQWGVSDDNDSNKSFPISFPSACRSLTGLIAGTQNIDEALTGIVVSASQFKFRGGNFGGQTVYWMAIGY